MRKDATRVIFAHACGPGRGELDDLPQPPGQRSSHGTPSLSRSSFPPQEQFAKYQYASSQLPILVQVLRPEQE